VMGVLPQLFGYPPHDLDDTIGVFLVRHSHVDHVTRPPFGHVGEGIDRTVGKHVDDTSEIPEHDRSKRDGLDEPTRTIDDGDITDPYLVFQHQKEPADEIADQVLGTEGNSQSEDGNAAQKQQ